jgi:hypothetical protein
MRQIRTRHPPIARDVSRILYLHPSNQPNKATVAEEDAPSGMLARGHYTAASSFIDDDKKVHLHFEWSFDIAKEW